MYGTELTLLCYNESGPSPTSDEPLVVRARELVVRTRARRPIDLARPVRSKRLRAVGDGPVLVAHVDELVVLDVRLKEALALEARALGEFLLVRDRLALQAAAVALADVAVCAHRLNSRVAAESVPQRLGAVVRRRRSSRRVEVVAASLGLAIRVGDVADDALEGVEDTVTAGHGCGLVWSWKSGGGGGCERVCFVGRLQNEKLCEKCE